MDRPDGSRSSGSLRQLAMAGTVTAVAVLAAAGIAPAQTPATPPVAPVRPVVDTLYGVPVVDPYRYMENLKDPEVQAWLKGENDYTRAVLERIPGRAQLLERIRQLDQAGPQVNVTPLPGDRYLLLERHPGDDVDKLYLRQGRDGEDRLLVDPAKITLAPGIQGRGRNTIVHFALSQDGNYVAVAVAPGGALVDAEIHVLQTATGRETGDVIRHVFGGLPNSHGMALWLPDNRSFVYVGLQQLPPGAPATELEQKVRTYVHVLGNDPAADRAIFGYGVVASIPVRPRQIAYVVVLPGSRYAVGGLNSGVSPNSALYIEPVADLGTPHPAWQRVASLEDDVGTGLLEGAPFALHGDALYLVTYRNAPRGEVIRTDARDPNLTTADTVVAPGQAVVTDIDAAADALYVQLMDGSITRVLRVPYGLRPHTQEVTLPLQGTVDVQTDPRVPGALLGITSWTKAHRLYAYDPDTGRVTDTGLQPGGSYDEASDVTSVEVKVASYDGTLVPLSIVYPEDMKLDGSNPVLLEGYGAYGMTTTPGFNAPRLAWYEHGGVYAVCHVRGGGAYGEPWHLAGKGPTKPNTWKDFIACAQYLIEKKYTSPARLAGIGGSAGGILIGRAITERPDLFAAAVDAVGLSDMVRAETMPNGVPNIAEFGSTRTKAGFEALYAMSAYHHVHNGTAYPAVLLLAGANDPFVSPWQMAKMTARLQAATASGKPILLRVDYAGGHAGFGATRSQIEEMRADLYSFLLWQLGVPGFQPGKEGQPPALRR